MDALVSTDWLAHHLNDPNLRIIEASYFVPGGVEKARQLYAEDHIPGTVFFDINAIADHSKPKDHAFPNAEIFAEHVGRLGISNNDRVVVYDRSGGTSAAARAWFMFRAFGHDKVGLLDGGHIKWAAENRPLTKDVPKVPTVTFRAKVHSSRLKGKHEIIANIESPSFQLLDARSKGRFDGTEPEPRAGLRSGHIPGSRSLPSLTLIDAAKTWKNPASLRKAFAEAGIDLNKPLTTTCGSGVTACALAFAAHLAGKDDTALYDGSWVEWGADPALPIKTGT